ncbi:MAG: polC [Candidatus Saccharibacteria bacterium]|nr:polC [Candidatus Saccharibacteria bacterium]MDB5181042.1 polC [Candidatus Saccharibacteria bacterium]
MFEYPVVFVDIETTGGSYRNSRVLEVAAIRYENGEIVKEFSTLIDPQTHIPQTITSITGITSADIIGAPVFEDIADELLEILDGAVFVAHNVRFDYSFLKQEFSLIGTAFSPRLLCTVRLSRYLYAGEKGHSLEKLIARHSIPVLDRHRALEDARAILYFSQLAYDQHGEEAFAAALMHQLKSQSLPPHLDLNELEEIGNGPGVYIFKDDTHQPIYVGKSITLRKRVLSHFQSTSPKEVKISQQVHHVETVPTGSELAALLLESKLIKELKPLYNRLLRRVSSYAMLVKKEQDGYSNLTVVSGSVGNETDLSTIYGVYTNRIKAKQTIDELTRLYRLCPKLMGLEKSKAACFSYSLGRCKGACIGEEDAATYNARFEIALERSKLSEWPFEGPVTIPVNQAGEKVVIENWIVQGFSDEDGNEMIVDSEPNFDLDEYKIIRRFIKENRHLIGGYA